MKNPEQMNDEELAVAVATEVLKYDEFELSQGPTKVLWNEMDFDCSHDLEWGDLIELKPIAAIFSGIIENNLKERGFGMELTISNDLLWPDKDFYASADISAPITEANFEGTVESYMWSCKCKYHALAIAALKAVRGEG